jgi:hypothetical protein
MRALPILLLATALVACGGRSTGGGSGDAGSPDAARDAASSDAGHPSDAPGGDRPAPFDALSWDSGSGWDGQICTADPGCQAYWCGCGQCAPAEVQCVTPAWANANPCMVGCVSSCPELQTMRCECRNDRCRAWPADAAVLDCQDRVPCNSAGACDDPGRTCCPLGGPLQACVPSTACCCWGGK